MAEDNDYLLDLQLATMNMDLGEDDDSNRAGQGAATSSIPHPHQPSLPAAVIQRQPAPPAAAAAPPQQPPPAAAAAAPPPLPLQQQQRQQQPPPPPPPRQGRRRSSRPRRRRRPAPHIPRQRLHGRPLPRAPYRPVPMRRAMRPYATGHPAVSKNDMLFCCSLSSMRVFPFVQEQQIILPYRVVLMPWGGQPAAHH